MITERIIFRMNTYTKRGRGVALLFFAPPNPFVG